MNNKTIYFSKQLFTTPKYKPSSERLFSALETHNISYAFIESTKDIWVRDFMPVRTKSGTNISFKYEPSYLNEYPQLRTVYKQDINNQFPLLNIKESDINLDGGNVVFSPSRSKVIISERVFSENSGYLPAILVRELERLLEAQVIIIPALPPKYDMTGHADGMVRFIDENTALGNKTDDKFENKIKTVLNYHGIKVIDFPYSDSGKNSAVGCYINYLETGSKIILPVFEIKTDNETIKEAEHIFKKEVIPVNIAEIAKTGGCLNCISWEL